jgi:type IV pilus assembly protein PilA
MARTIRCRIQDDRGFTLIELLIVILIIGIVAAIAIPSFLNQRGKANDVEAKSAAVTAAKAMQACATDNNGSYTNCDEAAITSIEPTLQGAASRMVVTNNANDYQVVVTSNRDSNAATFTLSRSSNGTTSRTCSTGTADKGGCSATSGGTW